MIISSSAVVESAAERNLLRVLEMGRMLAIADGDDQAFIAATAMARAALAADLSTLLVLNDQRTAMEVVAWDGEADGAAIRRLATPLGRNLVGICARDGKTLWSADTRSDPRIELPASIDCGILSAIVVPVKVDGQVEAVIAVDSFTPRVFTEHDERLLMALAEQLAVALSRTSMTSLQRISTERGPPTLSAQRVLQAATDNDGLEGLTKALGAMTGRTASVTNLSGVVVAPECDPGASNESSAIPEALAAKVRESFIDPSADEGRSARVVNNQTVLELRARRETIGYLIFDEPPVESCNLQLLEEAGRIAAMEMSRLRSIALAEQRLYGGIIEWLASGQDPQASAAACAYHDINLVSPFCAVAVDISAVQPVDRYMAVSAFSLATSATGLQGMATVIDDNLIGILGSSDRVVSRAVVYDWVERYRKLQRAKTGGGDSGIGISHTRPEPISALPQALIDARRALRVLPFSGSSEVGYFEDLELLALVDAAASRPQMEFFVNSCIGHILDYDRRKRSDLAHTLEVFLDHRGVIQHASNVLHLHPHSLRYRLRRIEELQGLDLDNPMVRLKVHFVLKLRQLVG